MAGKNGPLQSWKRTSQQPALRSYAAAVYTIVIKDEQWHSVERCQQTNIKGSENESEFECFIRSLNFRTLFNIPIPNDTLRGVAFCCGHVLS